MANPMYGQNKNDDALDLVNDNTSGRIDISSSQTVAKFLAGVGSGISGIAGAIPKVWQQSFNNVIKTSVFIDLAGLNSGGTAADIIGKDSTANCTIGQYHKDEMGELFNITMTCMETPTTAEPDIDLYSATEGTGTEDTPVTDLTEVLLIEAAGDWVEDLSAAGGGIAGSQALPAADGDYFYLAGSQGTDNTYGAGQLLIEFYGTKV